MLTLAAVAAHKGIAPQQIAVRVERRTDEERTWNTAFAVEVDLGSGLTRREQAILFNSARVCEVHRLLDGEMTFEYRMAADDR